MHNSFFIGGVLNDSICSTLHSKLSRILHWGPLFSLSIIFIIASTSFHCAVKYSFPFDSKYGFFQFIGICFWVYLILLFYFKSIFVGPGFVPYGWKPENINDEQFLQFCVSCNGFKPPRAHHCRTCKRCVLKMDHHCPFINVCCGHLNYGYFMLFLSTVIMGCITCMAALFTSLCANIGVFSVSHVKHQTSSLFYGLIEFSISIFAMGMAVGVLLGVSALNICQLLSVCRNQTGIENWIVSKAKFYREEIGDKSTFCYPYDLGKWNNFRQVMSWSGHPIGNGLTWQLKEGCGPFDLTMEQLRQKQVKKQTCSVFEVVRDYSGRRCSCCRYGCMTELRPPCFDEPRMRVCKGRLILVTRQSKYWTYGHLIDSDKYSENGFFKNGAQEKFKQRGWFPSVCARVLSKKKSKVKLS